MLNDFWADQGDPWPKKRSVCGITAPKIRKHVKWNLFSCPDFKTSQKRITPIPMIHLPANVLLIIKSGFLSQLFTQSSCYKNLKVFISLMQAHLSFDIWSIILKPKILELIALSTTCWDAKNLCTLKDWVWDL